MKRERVFALSQGMLSESDEREARAHLEGCESCRAMLEGYGRLDAVLEEWSPATEASPWFDARVRAAAAAVRPARSKRPVFGLSLDRWLATPALAALLIVSSVLIIRDFRLHSPATPPSAPSANLAAASAPPVRSQAGAQELNMYQNLPVLEDYDMLADFDVISELPRRNHKVAD
ncbi:MAG TPA: zf-HC2 domain-containing protein [Terriglobia bacterium]|nr:zf-HC2 domain-containing protein [Terriglobia bacterium]